jgi:hypothetical protein
MKKSNLFEELQRMKSLMVYNTDDHKHKINEEKSLLKEDIDPNSGGTITINNVYQAGFYTTKAIDQLTNKTIKDQLDGELIKVKEFLKNHKDDSTIVSVKFTSQESAIPNTDNERAGFFNSIRLNVGQLSSARKYYIDEYIKSYFKNLKEKGVISNSVDIPPVEYTFKKPVKLFKSADKKTTPWCVSTDTQIPKDDTQGYACTGGEFKVDGKPENNWKNNKKAGLYKSHYKEFVKEQNSSIEITVKVVESAKEPEPEETPKETPKEIPEEKVTLTYDDDVTPIPVTESCAYGLTIKMNTKKHECNNAEYFIFANETLLINSEKGMTHNGSNGGSPKKLGGKKVHPAALNPGFGKLGTKKYGTNGDIGNTRFDTFQITSEQSKKIVEQSTDGTMKIWAICAGDTMCHTDQQRIVIEHPKRDKPVWGPKEIKGNVVLLTVLSTCGDAVVKEQSISKLVKTEPDASSLRKELYSKRYAISDAITGGNEPSGPLDYKSELLSSVNDLSQVSDNIVDLIYNFYTTSVTKMKEKGKKDSNSISNQFYKYLANDTNKKAIQNEVIKFNNIYDSKETIETSEKKDEKIGKKMTIDLQFGKLKKGEPNFSIGDIGYAFRDKWIRTNELANDIRIELAKIYTSLGQIFTAESIQNGNLELKENMELFKYIANNKLKKSRDIDVEMNNNQNPESLASAEN